MKKNLVLIFVIVLCTAGTVLKFSASMEQLPVGCDEFGYLNLAKAFNNNRAFTDHAERPWLHGLLDTLRKSGVTENEICWMVTPHAYHVLPGSNQIINQYPPGTSALMSIFPVEIRKILFPGAAVLLLLLISFFILRDPYSRSFSWGELALPAFVLIMILSPPFVKEFARINSLVFTFGFLLAAGMMLKRNPFFAVFLIAVTVNFRVVNGLMLIPVVLFLPFSGNHQSKKIAAGLIIIGKCIMLCMLAAWPLLLYNYRLVGNPFAITYSAIDVAVTGREMISENLRFYFSITQGWLLFHLALIGTLLLLRYFHLINTVHVVKLLAFPLLNYLFFIFHAVVIDYYPYASAMIMAGAILVTLSKIKSTREKIALKYSIMLFLSFYIFVSGVLRYKKKEHYSFEEARNRYAALCDYDIVWADMLSGTTEYACDNSGFRNGPTTPRARKMAMKYLYDRNYSQAVLADDNLVEKNVITAELNEAQLPFRIETKSGIGEIIIIR